MTMMNKRTSGTEAILRAVLAAAGAVALAGCGGGTVVVHEPAPAPLEQPAEEPTETVTEEPAPEPESEVVVQEGNEPVVVERIIEVEREDPVITIQIEKEYFARHPHHQRLHGVAAVNFNTGYLDGWAAGDFFNHGKPLSDGQVDRMLEMGRRQGDPTGKLALPGYQEGYRAGAQRERNPYQRRMNAEQAARFRTMQGLPAEAPRPNTETAVRRDTQESEAARKARLEASKNRLEASRNNVEAARANREAEQKKLETARLEREAARKAEVEAGKQKREQHQVAIKNKLEAEKKQREAERQQRELAMKNKLEAEKKQREAARQQRELARNQKQAAEEAEQEAEKKARETKRDERTAAREKREAERKQKLAAKKAEREAKTQTADTSEAAK